MSTTRFEIKTWHGCFIWMYLWRKPTVFRKVSMAFSFYLIKLFSWAEQLRLQPLPGKQLLLPLSQRLLQAENQIARHDISFHYMATHVAEWQRSSTWLDLYNSKLILLFSKDALNWSKVMIKTFIMLQIISISDKCCSSELSIHQRNLNNSTQLFST